MEPPNPKVPATAPASSLRKYDAKSLRVALADRLTLSEAVELVGKLLDHWPSGRKGAADGYIGGLAAVLADYPRIAALRCCSATQGVARETKFLPTISDVVAFCERETTEMRSPVDREDHYARIQAEMAARRAAERARPRLERASLAELRARHGPNWGLQAMDDTASRRRNLEAVQKANEAAWSRLGGAVSGGIPVTEALLKSLKPEPDPQP